MLSSISSIVTILILYISLLKASKTTEPIPNFDLSSSSTTLLDPTKTGFTLGPSATNGEAFGQSLDSAGDIDADGYDDIIIGAPSKNSNRGAVYVIYGGSSLSFTNIDTSSITLDPATTGFIITGNAAGDRLGERVSRAGDINNDGYCDIIIGAPNKFSNRGAVYVIYGRPKSSLQNIDLSSTNLNPSITGFMIAGNAANDYFGRCVNPAGNVDKDDYDDIILGAPAGKAYVIYGGPKSSLLNIDLSSSSLNPTSTGFTLIGKVAGDAFGRWVNTAGDVNGDGYDDIVIGAYTYNGVTGAAYVIYGGQKSLLPNIDVGPNSLDPSTNGFSIIGKNVGDRTGVSVSTAGDIDNDGYDDIMIGAANFEGRGAVYVIYGGLQSSFSNIDLTSAPLDPKAGFMITGKANSLLGWPVTPGGDINGDGFPDLVIGAHGSDSHRGAAYVIYGGPKSSLSDIDLSLTPLDPRTTGFTIIGNSAGNEFGFAANAGDFNNDGFNDIIVGAYAKNSISGIAYVIHASCPTFQCDYCVSRICQACKTPYLLYQSWCLLACPTRTFNSNGKCQDCPAHCSSCISQKSCQTCDPGFILSDSLCVLPPDSPSYPKAETAATQAVSSSIRGISSVVNIGSATSPMTALVSKIVQNTRYLNLSVTDELSSIYQTWQTDLISWQVPNAIVSIDHYQSSPELFARYGLASSFVENFWATLVTIAASLVILLFFLGLKFLLDEAKSENWFASLVKKLIAGSFNFTLVQAYGCFDDILFYLVLDLKANPFNTFFSWASLICASSFLTLGCFLVFFNVWKVKQYQRIKTNVNEVQAFTQRNKRWELFFSDFNDTDIWTQSTLALLIVRSSLSSLIITTLYEYALMQTVYLVILDGFIILFLFFQNPFNTLRGKLAQNYFEAITLLVHFCTFILALQDTFPNPSETLRKVLSTSLIYLNTALITGSISFLAIELYKAISQKKREANQKQLENITIREETQDTQRILPTNRIHPQPFFDSHRKSNLRENERVSRLPWTGINLQPSNDYNLSMNTEDSILPDISLRINNALDPHLRSHFQPRRIQRQRNLSLRRNQKRSIKDFAHPID